MLGLPVVVVVGRRPPDIATPVVDTPIARTGRLLATFTTTDTGRYGRMPVCDKRPSEPYATVPVYERCYDELVAEPYATVGAYAGVQSRVSSVLAMSAFNELKAVVRCPNCYYLAEHVIQYKYGTTYQLEYELGDKIDWGGNQIGVPGLERVLVAGCGPTSCPNCTDRGLDFIIVIEDDRVVDVFPRWRGDLPWTDGHHYEAAGHQGQR